MNEQRKWNRQMYSTNQILAVMENFTFPSIHSAASMDPHPLLSPTVEMVEIWTVCTHKHRSAF